jgi:hypothetical protein
VKASEFSGTNKHMSEIIVVRKLHNVQFAQASTLLIYPLGYLAKPGEWIQPRHSERNAQQNSNLHTIFPLILGSVSSYLRLLQNLSAKQTALNLFYACFGIY